MMSFGSCRRQRTISTRCRSPTERSATTESGSSGRPYSAETLMMRALSAPRRGAPSRASAMFSATVSASNSEKCWNTMPMPSRRAAAGLGIVDRRALPADFARGRLQRAVEDLHQRRLAGAVLAEEGVDLARPDREVDVVVGAERGEILGDADRREGRARRPDDRLSGRRGWCSARPRVQPCTAAAQARVGGGAVGGRKSQRLVANDQLGDRCRRDRRRQLRFDPVNADRADELGDPRRAGCPAAASRRSKRRALAVEPIRPT